MSCDDHNHQSPTGEYNYNDYSEKMDDLKFPYDKNFYPLDSDLPDPQIDPVIPGAQVPIQKVGIGKVDLPIIVSRRPEKNGEVKYQTLQSQASLYCSLDDVNAKGLNLSRLYLLMHEKIRDHFSLQGIKDVLKEMADKQGSSKAFCKLAFKYPWIQRALRSRQDLTQDEIDNGEYETLSDGTKISLKKLEGHIAYDCEIEGVYDQNAQHPTISGMTGQQYKFYLTIKYVYSSTCPCSFELAHNATHTRGQAANAHSQRSVATVKVEFDPDNIIWIEDLVELCRRQIPTEVQIVVKRRDEQAFAELNGSNLLFSEDVARLMYKALNDWYETFLINDFSVVVSHEESLHPWNAIAVIYKGIKGGLR